jgi:long-subunit fatty acid transport protein
MKKLLAVGVVLFFTGVAYAQKKATVNDNLSFTAAIGAGDFSTAFGYQHMWQVGKKNKLGLGVGAKLTNYFTSKKYYTTAPAKLTSGKTGPAVFFAENIPANIDSVLLNKSQVNALNLSLNITYKISKKFMAGFSIDAIGFSFGAKQNGTYFANSGAGTVTSGKPTGFNALLISDNDLGSLNSDFYAQYSPNNKWGIKAGFQFLFTEFTTATEVQTTPSGIKNDRFRYKSGALAIGVVRNL